MEQFGKYLIGLFHLRTSLTYQEEDDFVVGGGVIDGLDIEHGGGGHLDPFAVQKD